jgi:PPOX class probable F420-dependent enzyme
MAALEQGARELLAQPLLAWVTTLTKDGAPHTTGVWIDVDGDEVVFNTAVGRVKERHLRADPRISVALHDPANQWHTLSVTGTAQLVTDGADAHIDAMAKKYLGKDTYPFRAPGEQRVIVRVTPQKVLYSSGG